MSRTRRITQKVLRRLQILTEEVPGQALLDAGLVDFEYYEAQVGYRFVSERIAMHDIMSMGVGRFAPHPLLDYPWLPVDKIDPIWQHKDLRPLFGYIAHFNRRTGPFFDPASVAVAGRKPTSPLGVFGDFVRTLTPDTPMPGLPWTYGELRSRLVAGSWGFYEERKRLDGERRFTDTWDEAADAAWKARWAQAPLPETEGPLVSVIMPVRNRRDLVQVAIASVQRQTLQNWELVVVDDGSDDDTAEVVAAIAALDPRVRLVRGPKAGVSAARNRGIESATAPLTAFLDSDNEWREDFLRVAIAAMHGQGLHAAYAGLTFFDARGVRHYRAFPGTPEQLEVANFVDLNVLIVDTALLRRIGGFDESLKRWVDHDLAMRLTDVTELKLLPFIAVDYSHDERDDRITSSESEAWQYVVLAKRWTDWATADATIGDRVKGRVSIVIPTWQDAHLTYMTLDAVRRNSDGVDVEIIVVDNGSGVPYAASLPLICEIFNATYVRLKRNVNFAAGSNVGLVHSTGEYVLFLNNDTEPRPGWLPPLLKALQDDPETIAVQPLLQYPDDSIQSAGTVFPLEGYLPTHFLVGHPPEDAERIQDTRLPAITAAAMLMRAADAIEARGFDPLYINGWEDVDLCLRLRERHGGHFRLVPASRVTHHESKTPGRSAHIQPNRELFASRWRDHLTSSDLHRWHDLGFATIGFHPESAQRPSARPIVVRPRHAPAEGLRWGLRLPSLGGEAGDAWGDTHFGASFAAALRELGQEVVTHRHGTHRSEATGFDDVAVTIRGLDAAYPAPGQVNVLWIISHPEDVTRQEVAEFDLVYAASAPWAAKMSAAWGREIRPLLQATDLRRRADMSIPVGDGRTPVFVGGAYAGRERPVATAVSESGVDAVFHGPNWGTVLPKHLVGRSYIPNAELAGVYRAAGLVLADHWGDMADEGFIANRLFDAVASGARVISDQVDGLGLFGGAVQVFRNAADLRRLTSPEGRTEFPSDAEMETIADRVAAEHSFDARAATMLTDVSAVIAAR